MLLESTIEIIYEGDVQVEKIFLAILWKKHTQAQEFPTRCFDMWSQYGPVNAIQTMEARKSISYISFHVDIACVAFSAQLPQW